jgi:protein-disulfide isomerase
MSSEGEKANADQAIAIIAGEPIYERDLAASTATQMLQIHQQEYKIKTQALGAMIRTRLVENEAKKQGISVDKLYEKEVDSKISDPSDGEVAGYYLAVKAQMNQPLQEVQLQLQKAVMSLKIQQARDEYADFLRSKVEVVVLLQPPKVAVDYDSARIRGNPAAPVTILEFSDFQCPYCKKVVPTLNDLLTKYEGRVKLAYRDFPLRQLHPQAQMAAEAARCAEEQGKFWEYHDALFAEQAKLDENTLTASARKLGLDESVFQGCLKGGKFKPQIEQDVQAGIKAGVAGTPGFFINGEFVNGAQSLEEFEKIIDRELADGSGASSRASR